MADTMQFHPDVLECAQQLQELSVNAPSSFAALRSSISDQHRQMRKGLAKSIALKLGLEPNTVAALGGREAVAAVALHAAGRRRHDDALAALSTDQRKALLILQPDPEERAEFLARAGATP